MIHPLIAGLLTIFFPPFFLVWFLLVNDEVKRRQVRPPHILITIVALLSLVACYIAFFVVFMVATFSIGSSDHDEAINSLGPAMLFVLLTYIVFAAYCVAFAKAVKQATNQTLSVTLSALLLLLIPLLGVIYTQSKVNSTAIRHQPSP